MWYNFVGTFSFYHLYKNLRSDIISIAIIKLRPFLNIHVINPKMGVANLSGDFLSTPFVNISFNWVSITI